jgi:DNA-binding MarR family transcriptional regulator
MRFEDEIKQTKPFKSEVQKLILNIAFTNSWFNNILIEKLKAFDLSPQQFNVLRILKGRYPDSYCNQEITQRMLDKSSNVTRIVDKLLDKKLVSRCENACDRRAVDILLTETGLNLLNEIEAMPFFVNSNFQAFDEEKARLMNEWLDELRG